MKVVCVEKINGFTLGKVYDVIIDPMIKYCWDNRSVVTKYYLMNNFGDSGYYSNSYFCELGI